MMTLFHSPATAAMVVHWLLIELELPHLLHPLDLAKGDQKSPDYLKLNPAGVVPTLLIDGQPPLCEAAAIALYLAELCPARALLPAPATPARAQCYRWMFFLANTLQPAYRAWFYPTEPAGPDNVEASKREARTRIESAWGQVAAHLESWQPEFSAGGPYMLGDQMSVVDFMTTMLMRWSRNMPKPVDRWPILHSYAQRMKSLPSWQEMYRREGLTEWA